MRYHLVRGFRPEMLPFRDASFVLLIRGLVYRWSVAKKLALAGIVKRVLHYGIVGPTWRTRISGSRVLDQTRLRCAANQAKQLNELELP